jgi:orotidine 5'-phosphate decarboxylase subfamily 1
LNLSFYDRAAQTTNPTAKALLQLMDTKKTNLCLSADLSCAGDVLALADKLGPQICVFKTHVDIIQDFTRSFASELTNLSEKHNFIIFEDRKFADIGHTVKEQYGKGLYSIADWAPITNAHILPGEGIIDGLKSIGLNKGNGLLLLAQMSSKGNLFNEAYTASAVEMAKAHRDFVIGFITQHRLTEDPAFISFTPGISSTDQGDALGQQYVTPRQAILENHTDVIIVGRGIYGATDPIAAAEAYRAEAWQAYTDRLCL